MGVFHKTPDGLLECPFCGSEPELRDGSSTTPYIRCKSCGCRTGSSRNVEKLVEAWNRRTSLDVKALDVEEMRDYFFDLLEGCDEPEYSFYSAIVDAACLYLCGEYEYYVAYVTKNQKVSGKENERC